MSREDARRHRRSPSVEESRVGDRVVLYHRDSREALVLNPTGSLLWQLLAAPYTTGELAGKLQAHFSSVTAPQAINDASAFVRALRDHKVIVSDDV